MKIQHFAPIAALFLGAALTLGGCAAAIQTNEEIDKGVGAPKRSMDMAKAIETDSNINQINMAIGMSRAPEEGETQSPAPPTLEAAKLAAKVPSEMWIDGETGQPLLYDAATATVKRAPRK